MSGSTPPLLQATSLRKSYRLRSGSVVRQIMAVDDVSIAIPAGTTLAIVGESGCGKTTLAKLITQLETPDAGDLVFDGRPISARSRSERKAFSRDVQMIFQDPYGSLTPHFRVGTLIAEPLRIHRLATASTLPNRIAEILDSVGLHRKSRDGSRMSFPVVSGSASASHARSPHGHGSSSATSRYQPSIFRFARRS